MKNKNKGDFKNRIKSFYISRKFDRRGIKGLEGTPASEEENPKRTDQQKSDLDEQGDLC